MKKKTNIIKAVLEIEVDENYDMLYALEMLKEWVEKGQECGECTGTIHFPKFKQVVK